MQSNQTREFIKFNMSEAMADRMQHYVTLIGARGVGDLVVAALNLELSGQALPMIGPASYQASQSMCARADQPGKLRSLYYEVGIEFDAEAGALLAKIAPQHSDHSGWLMQLMENLACLIENPPKPTPPLPRPAAIGQPRYH